MVDDDQIARSKSIQQQTGKTFHLATRLLPERVREATYVLYAFFRVADEVVDDAEGVPPEAQRRELEAIRAAVRGERETDDPVLAAVSELREDYDLADDDINVFIDAMIADIDTDEYATYDELEAYMDGSASAVGRMMTDVMAPDNPEQALPHATALGEAFQLTNFLRDVREDIVERDRIYLPQSTLEQHGVTNDQLRRFEMDDNFNAEALPAGPNAVAVDLEQGSRSRLLGGHKRWWWRRVHPRGETCRSAPGAVTRFSQRGDRRGLYPPA